MVSKTLPLPDLCHANHDWNPIAAASNQSAMAAVLAGFVFGGIVVILTVSTSSHKGDAARALKLLFTAFIGLTVTAYLFADLAGEQTCPRAQTEEVIAGGMLGTFAIIMLVSLTWLVLAYERNTYEVLEFLHRLIYLAMAFVVLLLTTSSEGYLSAELQYGSHTTVNALIYATGVLAVVGPGIWILLRSRGQHSKRKSNLPDENATPEADPCSLDKAVSACARITLAYLALSSLAAGVSLSVAAKSWYPIPAPWAAYAAAWGALVLPFTVLVFAIRALARPHSDDAQLAHASSSHGKQLP